MTISGAVEILASQSIREYLSREEVSHIADELFRKMNPEYDPANVYETLQKIVDPDRQYSLLTTELSHVKVPFQMGISLAYLGNHQFEVRVGTADEIDRLAKDVQNDPSSRPQVLK